MSNDPNQIQKPPIGLLDQLGILNQGQNPRTMLNSVQPTLDLGAHYRARELQTFSQLDTGIQLAGSSSIVTVPQGETWILVAAGLSISTGVAAGTIYDFSLFVRTGTTQNSVPIFNFVKTLASTSDRVDVGLMLPEPLVLPSGSIITWMLQRPITPSIGITSRHMIQRLRTGA